MNHKIKFEKHWKVYQKFAFYYVRYLDHPS